MRRALVLAVVLALGCAIVGCPATEVKVRTEIEHKEKVVDKTIVETGDSVSKAAPETTTTRTKTEESTINSEPVVK